MTDFILNHSIVFSLHWLKSDGSLLIFSFIVINMKLLNQNEHMGKIGLSKYTSDLVSSIILIFNRFFFKSRHFFAYL